jgi:hypothetical protein
MPSDNDKLNDFSPDVRRKHVRIAFAFVLFAFLLPMITGRPLWPNWSLVSALFGLSLAATAYGLTLLVNRLRSEGHPSPPDRNASACDSPSGRW